MQFLNLATKGDAYRRRNSREKRAGRMMLRRFIDIANAALEGGGHASFEWPRDCTGWLEGDLILWIGRWNLYVVDFHGCACGYVHPVSGQPFLKPLRFVTSSPQLAASLSTLQCKHPRGYVHAKMEGFTKPTESYPPRLCHTILSSLFGYDLRCPIMTCVPVSTDTGHRQKELPIADFGISPWLTPVGVYIDESAIHDFPDATDREEIVPYVPPPHVVTVATAPVRDTVQAGPCQTWLCAAGINQRHHSNWQNTYAAVTKALDYKTARIDPKAIQAIRAEADELIAAGTWDESTVISRAQLTRNAQRQKRTIHVGQLLSIASI